MIQNVIRLVRGYTDALFAGFTKETRDGRKVVYPWGLMGRGYVIANGEIEEQLKQRYAMFAIAVTFLLGIASSLGGLAGGFAVLIVCLVGYVVYAKRLVAGMEPSNEGLPIAEAYAAMARAYTPRQLWSWVSCGIFLIGIGIVIVVTGQPGFVNPEFGILPDLGIFFGFGILVTAFGGWMLWLRRGADPSAGAASPVVKSVVAEEAAFYVTGQVGPIRAWFIAIFGLVLTGVFAFILVTDREARSGEMYGAAAMFGLVAAFGVSLLVLRYRERHR